ncbi:MAG: ATP synthase F0 subunit B [Clostridia bacterium]
MDGYSIESVISSLLLNILNIVALFLILRALVYKPVRGFLKARTDKLEAEANEAKAKIDEAERIHEEYLLELSRAKEDANLQSAQILDSASGAAQKIQDQSKAEADALILKARQQVQHEHDDAVRQLRREASDIAVDIASRVLEREIKSQDNANIVNSYFDALAKKSAGGEGI